MHPASPPTQSKQSQKQTPNAIAMHVRNAYVCTHARQRNPMLLSIKKQVKPITPLKIKNFIIVVVSYPLFVSRYPSVYDLWYPCHAMQCHDAMLMLKASSVYAGLLLFLFYPPLILMHFVRFLHASKMYFHEFLLSTPPSLPLLSRPERLVPKCC